MNSSKEPNVDDCYLVLVEEDVDVKDWQIIQESESINDILPVTDKGEEQCEVKYSEAIKIGEDDTEMKLEVLEDDDYIMGIQAELSQPCQVNDDIDSQSSGKVEDHLEDDDYIMRIQAELSQPCQVNDDIDSQSSGKVKTKRRNKWTSKNKKGCYTKHSFIEDLRIKNPTLRDDEEKLIEKIVEAMKNCKPQEPPDYFIRENYVCFYCGMKSKMLYYAKRHYEEVHGPKYLMCFACGERFRSRSNLHRHEKKSCSAVDIDIVLKARAISVGRRGTNRPFLDPNLKLQKRKRKQYPYKKRCYFCTECTAEFASRVALVSHMNVHNGVRPYRCEMCPAAYTSKPNLRRHIKSHNPDKFICDYCGKVVHHKQSIVDHVKQHMFEKRFVCEFEGCDKRYANKNAWQRHIEVVHKKLPVRFPCTMCDKRLATSARLKIHMKKVHNMELMTRTMFHRALPKMSDEAIQSNASFSNSKVVVIAVDGEKEAKDEINEYFNSS